MVGKYGHQMSSNPSLNGSDHYPIFFLLGNASFNSNSSNSSSNTSWEEVPREGLDENSLRWGVLGLLLVIVCSAVGNVLVCLAVCWERRLQNMTNYFLMSLAIADLLVSIVVMPLGMIVELFGYFPLEAEVCVLWVSSDVLLCTASIWHMCTMSMDRYFTLKYPMRYGRNKTKTMVLAKIFFVWVVSVAISSPICIHGFVDPTIVFTGGACVPVLKDFVIYGSIFAFYIPLLIMIVTYVLTINLLWRNQELMQRIGQSELRPKLAQLTAQCSGVALPHIPRYMKPAAPEEDERATDSDLLDGVSQATAMGGASKTSNHNNNCSALSNSIPTYFACPPRPPPLLSQADPSESLRKQDNSAHHGQAQQYKAKVAPRYTRSASPRHFPTDSDTDDDEADQLHKHLLQYKSMSYRSLSRKASNDDLFLRARSAVGGGGGSSAPHQEADTTQSFRQRGERRRGSKAAMHLDVPSQVFYRRGKAGGSALYNAKSDTQLPSSSWCSPASEPGPLSFHLSFNGLAMDYKSMEWDRRFFQIQQEMDACLLDNDSDANKHTRSTKDKAGKLPASKLELKKATKSWLHYPVSVVTPPAPTTAVKDASDSDDDPDTSASSNSDVITIRLHPPASPSVKSAHDIGSGGGSGGGGEGGEGSGAQSDTSVIPSVVVSSEADNTQEDSDILNTTNDESPATDTPQQQQQHARASGGGSRRNKHKRLLKARFRNTIRASSHPMLRHLLSKKTASNERKASKVLGIIFIVFVTLWTPFFIVNILSVTCSSCMEGLTGEMMSVFTWMGYVASLANPIIYTMFNTSFRCTFIKILTCRMQPLQRRAGFWDNHLMSNNTTTVIPSDRRNTMTVVLDSRS